MNFGLFLFGVFLLITLWMLDFFYYNSTQDHLHESLFSELMLSSMICDRPFLIHAQEKVILMTSLFTILSQLVTLTKTIKTSILFILLCTSKLD